MINGFLALVAIFAMIFGLRHWNNNGWVLYICGVLGLGRDAALLERPSRQETQH